MSKYRGVTWSDIMASAGETGEASDFGEAAGASWVIDRFYEKGDSRLNLNTSDVEEAAEEAAGQWSDKLEDSLEVEVSDREKYAFYDGFISGAKRSSSSVREAVDTGAQDGDMWASAHLDDLLVFVRWEGNKFISDAGKRFSGAWAEEYSDRALYQDIYEQEFVRIAEYRASEEASDESYHGPTEARYATLVRDEYLRSRGEGTSLDELSSAEVAESRFRGRNRVKWKILRAEIESDIHAGRGGVGALTEQGLLRYAP